MGLQAFLAQQIEGDASESGDIFWGMVLPDTYEEHRWANVFPGNATFTARTFTKMITIAETVAKILSHVYPLRARCKVSVVCSRPSALDSRIMSRAIRPSKQD